MDSHHHRVRRDESSTLVDKLIQSLGGDKKEKGKEWSQNAKEAEAPDYRQRSVHLRHGRPPPNPLPPFGTKEHRPDDDEFRVHTNTGNTATGSYKTTQVIDVDEVGSHPKDAHRLVLPGSERWQPNLGLGSRREDVLEDLDGLNSSAPRGGRKKSPSMYHNLIGISSGKPTPHFHSGPQDTNFPAESEKMRSEGGRNSAEDASHGHPSTTPSEQKSGQKSGRDWRRGSAHAPVPILAGNVRKESLSPYASSESGDRADDRQTLSHSSKNKDLGESKSYSHLCPSASIKRALIFFLSGLILGILATVALKFKYAGAWEDSLPEKLTQPNFNSSSGGSHLNGTGQDDASGNCIFEQRQINYLEFQMGECERRLRDASGENSPEGRLTSTNANEEVENGYSEEGGADETQPPNYTTPTHLPSHPHQEDELDDDLRKGTLNPDVYDDRLPHETDSPPHSIPTTQELLSTDEAADSSSSVLLDGRTSEWTSTPPTSDHSSQGNTQGTQHIEAPLLTTVKNHAKADEATTDDDRGRTERSTETYSREATMQTLSTLTEVVESDVASTSSDAETTGASIERKQTGLTDEPSKEASAEDESWKSTTLAGSGLGLPSESDERGPSESSLQKPEPTSDLRRTSSAVATSMGPWASSVTESESEMYTAREATGKGAAAENLVEARSTAVPSKSGAWTERVSLARPTTAQPQKTPNGGDAKEKKSTKKRKKNWFERFVEVVQEMISNATPIKIKSREDGSLHIAVS